jgi:hypothetical protein
MKSFCKCGALLTFAWLGAVSSAGAQTSPYGSQSLLPFPATAGQPQSYGPIYRTASTAPLLASDYGPALAASQIEPIAQPLPPDSSPSDLPANPALNTGPYGKLGTDTSMFPNPTTTTSCGSDQCGSGCSSCIPCCTGSGQWFGSIGGLAMTRNNPNPFWTTYQTNQNSLQLMNTSQATGNWGGGGQVTFGRWWCGCGCNAGIGLQVVYWQVFGMGGYSNLTSASSNLSTPIDLGGVNITSGAGTFPAGNFFDNSPEHRIWRNDQILNLELNVLHQQIYASPNRVNLTCLAGFRYFRFQEALTFGSVAFGDTFGQNGGADEAYLRTQVTNNLFGAQIGLLANWSVTQRCGFYALPKMGVFGNNITARNQLYTGDGYSQFDIHSTKNALSLLGELDLGTYFWLSPNCQLFAGWRVIGVSQVALGDNQILPYLADTAGYGTIKANGDLILTGGFAGLAFTF